MDATIIVPVIVAIVMSLPGIFSFVTQYKKEMREAASRAQQDAIGIAKLLREEVSLLRTHVSELEGIININKIHIDEQDRIIKSNAERTFNLEKVIQDKDVSIVQLKDAVVKKEDIINAMNVEIQNLRSRVEILETKKTRSRKTPGSPVKEDV